MKKTVCIILTLSFMLTVFFFFFFYAGTLPITWRFRSNQMSVNDVSMTVYASQYAPYDGSVDIATSENVIQSEDIYIVVILTNNSDNNKLVSSVGYKLNLVDTSGQLYADYVDHIISFDKVYGDFSLLSAYNDGWYWTRPDSDYSYNVRICIPSHTTLTTCYKLSLPTFTDPGQYEVVNRQKAFIDSIDLNAGMVVDNTDYVPNGSHKDVTDAIDNISSYISSASGIPLLHSDLVELANILKSNQTTNQNITNDSNSLKTQSDSVHSQEQSYYAQNTQAIEATGLSNYQFDNNSVSGLQGVRGDFIAVWNALSGWNAVYIFSLTLGLALTILRHSPSAISSAINRRKFKSNGGKTP